MRSWRRSFFFGVIEGEGGEGSFVVRVLGGKEDNREKRRVRFVGRGLG